MNPENEPTMTMIDIEKEVKELRKTVDELNKWAISMNSLVNNNFPAIDSAAMLALYTLAKMDKVKVPAEWTVEDYKPLQKLITSMNKIMDEAAKKKKEAVDRLNGKTTE